MDANNISVSVELQAPTLSFCGRMMPFFLAGFWEFCPLGRLARDLILDWVQQMEFIFASRRVRQITDGQLRKIRTVFKS